jgi:hypothetical protein
LADLRARETFVVAIVPFADGFCDLDVCVCSGVER